MFYSIMFCYYNILSNQLWNDRLKETNSAIGLSANLLV